VGYLPPTGRARSFHGALGIWAFESPTVKTSIDNIAKAIQGIPTFLQPDFLVVPGKCFAFFGPLHVLLTSGGNYYVQKCEEWDNATHVTMPGRPIVQAFEGEHAIAILLSILNTWISGAGPRSANFMNYMNGVDFGTSIWSTQVYVKG
jgi:hypothetical protein